MMRTKNCLINVVVSVVAAFCAVAQPPMEMTATKPKPEFRNVAYGEHERHVFDLWQAKSATPTPLLIFFHGGGFVGGDKWNLDRSLLDAGLDAGISVASANYRKSSHAIAPASMIDGARVVQYIRLNAAEFNVDPAKIGVCGDSAGAGISQWIAFHDDLADPENADPVQRQSSRVSAVAVVGGQCSYDPRFIREVIGGRAWEHPALTMLYGIKPEELDTEKAYKLYEIASPITYLTRDDPPLFGYYAEPREPLKPGPHTGPTLYYPGFAKDAEGHDRPGWGIHHPNFGYYLQKQMQGLGIVCIIRHRDAYPDGEKPAKLAHQEMAAFFRNVFDGRPLSPDQPGESTPSPGT